jgi:hypothetical protein
MKLLVSQSQTTSLHFYRRWSALQDYEHPAFRARPPPPFLQEEARWFGSTTLWTHTLQVPYCTIEMIFFKGKIFMNVNLDYIHGKNS